jgi:predicted Ser/Thr protein kinase
VIGKTISHYHILVRLGEGGMGVVYKAEDTRLDRFVALKFLPEDLARDHQALERFRREAKAASALNHPNICTIYDIGGVDSQTFIAMELMEGQSLRDVIASGPVTIDRILEWGLQIADALDASHGKGIVHRDLKPGNIFITSRGQAKLLDFGLAKMVRTRGADTASPQPTLVSDMTAPGSVFGTIEYMSPEQVRGEPLDSRTDLFSFGVVLYEMTTGKRPFAGDTAGLIFDSILNRAPVAPIQLNPKLPSMLGEIINRALEKDRTLRYQSAFELTADLLRVRNDSRFEAGSAVGMFAQQTIPRVIAEQPLTVAASRAEKAVTHRMWFRAVLGGAAFLIVLLVAIFFSGLRGADTGGISRHEVSVIEPSQAKNSKAEAPRPEIASREPPQPKNGAGAPRRKVATIQAAQPSAGKAETLQNEVTAIEPPQQKNFVAQTSQPEVAPIEPPQPKKSEAEKVKDYVLGTWEFKRTVSVPSTSIVSTYELEFSPDGEFSLDRSVNGFLQDQSVGTWSVLSSSSDSFTLTLDYRDAGPKSLALRVIDQNSAKDGNNTVFRRIR